MNTSQPQTKTKISQWIDQCSVSLWAAQVAIETALNMPYTYQVLHWTRTGELEKHMPPRPPGHIWKTLYEKPARVIYGAGEFLADDSESFRLSRQVFKEGRSIGRRIKRSPDRIRAWAKQVTSEQVQKFFRIAFKLRKRGLHAFMQDVHKELKKTSHEEDEVDLGKSLSENPELYSYIRLSLPALFLYQQTPQQIRREASAYNPSAIERLLRLDSEMIDDPSIRAWVYDATGETRETRRKCVHKWAGEGFNGRWDYGSFRKSMAAMISALSEKMNYRITVQGLVPVRLTAQDIQDLFIAVDQDRAAYGTYETGYPCAFSDDLEVTSISREIARMRQPWINYWFPTPDKSPI